MMKLLTILFLLIPVSPLTSTGNTFPGTGSNIDRAGNSDWTSPGNILADENTNASITGVAGSDYLVASNFNFSAIPFNAKILGVTVRIAAAETSSGSETTSAQLQNETGALFGSATSQAIGGTSETIYTYGSATDLWGLANNTIPATITPDIIKDADFGCRFWFTSAHNMTVDYVTIAIEYSTGAGFFRAFSSTKTFKLKSI